MSSSQARSNGGGERPIHQDYIARIRYSNALPPPPVPPKLLDIPNTGLTSGQYTTPGFASRLAREQPLNVEADAELGMPLDLVGMPGVFDGDESSIQPPDQAPPVHHHDRALLRPLSTLGKPKMGDTSVSFLRRTEYISSVQAKRPDNVFIKSASTNPAVKQRPLKRKASPEPDKGTPAWIKRRIEKSFEAAAATLADRSRIRHPSKRHLKLVESFPLLPDPEAFPDSGAYVTVKFSTNPVTSSTTYDDRLLTGIFKPIERSDAEEEAFEQAFALHLKDPDRYPKPSHMMNYDFFLAADAKTSERFRQKFDVDNPDRDSKALYTSTDDGGCFRFPRVRAYETAQEKEMNHLTKYDEEVILVYRDADETKGLDKAVCYYPVMQRSTIRSQRTKNIARTIGITDEEETHLDELHVHIDDPSEELQPELDKYKNQPVDFLPEEEEDEDEEDGERKNGSGSSHHHGRTSTSPAAADGRSHGEDGEHHGAGGSEDDDDAEGDEE